MAFPLAPLDVDCELDLSGTWTSVKGYLYQRGGTQAPVRISRGRPDESSRVNPSSCRWEWDNRGGRFSPRNPLSPYYGQLKRNTPVRFSVPAASGYLRLENDSQDRAAVADNATLHVSGSIEMRMSLRLTDWRACVLACKWDGGGDWLWLLNSDGTLTFGWYDSSAAYHAVTSSAPLPYAAGDFGLRVTMDATSGTVTFYTASGASLDGTWAQLGGAASGTGGAATSVATAASPLVVGWSANVTGQLYGRVYEYRLYNGLAASPSAVLDTTGGPVLDTTGGQVLVPSPGVAADADFAAQPAGVTSFTDSAGNDWQVQGGAEVSARDYRFHGEMSSQPPRWDVTGTDMSVRAQAGGPLRRLAQGSKNAMSAMKRAILLQAGSLYPVAYWPMEDAAGATQFGAAVGGLAASFDANPAPKLASDSSFTASAPLPSLNGSRVQAPVPSYSPTGTWTVRFLMKYAAPAAAATLLRIVTDPGAACPVVYVNADTAGNLELIGYAQNGSEAFNTGYVAYGATGQTWWMSVEATPSGTGSTQYNLVALAPGAAAAGELPSPPVVAGDPGAVSLVQPDVTGAFTGTVLGHLSVQSAWTSMFSLGQPLNAWAGEAAAARYARLAGENGWQARILGSPDASAAMGAQGQATLAALLAECEDADRGQQFEPRQQLALGYRTLASMCNQSPALSLSYTASEPGGVSSGGGDSGLDPVYDDRLTANDWTVTRGAASGSQGATWQAQLDDGSAMSVSPPPSGAGDYAKTATVNVEYDSQVPDVAGWLVHLGTVDDERWPVIPVNLARPEMSAKYAAALAVGAGDMVEIASLPTAVVSDPVKQLALGFKESLGGFRHTVEYSTVPEQPYEVIILDDPVYGRVDTSGSTLAAGATATATTLSVSSSGIPWTTAAGDVPFDVEVSGERMTVTAVSGASSPQTFSVTRSVNGVVKAQSSGADVRLWFPPVLGLS